MLWGGDAAGEGGKRSMEYLIQSIFLKRPTNASLKNTVMYLAKPELGGKNSVDLSLEDKATVNVNKKVK